MLKIATEKESRKITFFFAFPAERAASNFVVEAGGKKKGSSEKNVESSNYLHRGGVCVWPYRLSVADAYARCAALT